MLKKILLRSVPFCVIFLGIVIRFAWIFYMKTYPETDFMWYHVKGVELSCNMGFLNGIYPFYTGKIGCPTAFRPIGYPLTLAILYSIFGTNFLVAKIFNILLSTLSMISLYKLCKMFFSNSVSNFALALFAFSPLSICYTSIIGSETLFQTLLLLITYNLFHKKNPYILGILVGYLALVRPIGIFFCFCLILFLLLEKSKNNIKFITTFSLTFLLVISGWLIRNYVQFGQVIYSTNGGYVLYVNNNPYATGSWSDPYSYPNSPFKKYLFKDNFDELAINREGKKLAIKWISDNPDQFLYLASKRIINSYWAKLDDIMWAFPTGLNIWDSRYVDAIKLETFLYRPFYILTFVYIIYVIIDFIKNKIINIHTFILIVFLYFNFMMFVLEGNSRYVFPLHPIYSIGVAFILIKITQKFRALFS
ncbi:MAG: glycosyltransferase family 39 protein [Clostridiales bacterium]|nr:glycosyltransferase family 39 protein [Clostridiales bacterium]